MYSEPNWAESVSVYPNRLIWEKTGHTSLSINLLVSQQLFGKLVELSNQLTSDEPKENVDASPAMLARQEQLQDAILSASGQMQKESQALLDELRKVSDMLTT